MAKKRSKRRQPARQAPRTSQAAQKGEARPKPEPKQKATVSQSSARQWVWPVVIVLVIAAALLVSQTLFGKEAARPATPWTLTILHTTDVGGYLDPCG